MSRQFLSSAGLLSLTLASMPTVVAAQTAGAAAQDAAGTAAQDAGAATQDAGQAPQDTGGLGDVVVTARRDSERLINVPVQVSVQSGAELTRTNANDLPKVSEGIPFVTVGKTTSGNGGGFVIRGIGNFSGDVGVKQTVLLNLDNAFVGRAKILNQGLYDVGQVEVLKGPQALFFGKNSPAGVISVNTRDPGKTIEGFVRASYEFEADEHIVEGAVSLPFSDRFGIRVAGRVGGMKGYLRNNAVALPVHPLFTFNPVRFAFLANAPVSAPYTSRSPESEDLAARITALWEPNSDLLVKLKYAFGYTEGNGDGGTVELTCRPGINAIVTAGVVDPRGDCRLDKNIAWGAFSPALAATTPFGHGGQPYNMTESHITSLNIDYDAGAVAINSITGYYSLAYEGAQNSFFDSLGSIWNPQTEDSSGFSQELRLTTQFESAFNFVLGGYYGQTKQQNRTFAQIVALGIGYDPVGQTYDAYHRLIRQNSTTWSAFGQLRWSIVESLELNAGVRYTNERNTDFNGNTYAHPLAVSTPSLNYRPGGDFFDRRQTFKDWSPEATLTWHPTEDQTLYVAYKTGFKSGGFSAPPVLSRAFSDADTRFEPETVEGYEAGYKALLLDSKLSFQLTAYRYDYANQQVTIFVPASLGFLVRNAAESRVQGIEAQATLRPVRELTLNAAFGYNDAKFISYRGAACFAGQTAAQGCVPFNGSTAQDLSGQTLPRAPKWAGNFGFAYDADVNESFGLSISGNALYSSSYLPQENLDPFLRQNAYWKINASIAIRTVDEKFELALVGRNLTDEYIIQNSQDKGFGVPGIYAPNMARPRELSIQGTVRF
jgi:iron complex outermembrane receptor protein